MRRRRNAFLRRRKKSARPSAKGTALALLVHRVVAAGLGNIRQLLRSDGQGIHRGDQGLVLVGDVAIVGIVLVVVLGGVSGRFFGVDSRVRLIIIMPILPVLAIFILVLLSFFGMGVPLRPATTVARRSRSSTRR